MSTCRTVNWTTNETGEDVGTCNCGHSVAGTAATVVAALDAHRLAPLPAAPCSTGSY